MRCTPFSRTHAPPTWTIFAHDKSFFSRILAPRSLKITILLAPKDNGPFHPYGSTMSAASPAFILGDKLGHKKVILVGSAIMEMTMTSLLYAGKWINRGLSHCDGPLAWGYPIAFQVIQPPYRQTKN
ncbi:hypothetical protein BDW72DRAFT_187900 [Aspergillus terricola var. indicus]